MVAKVTQRGYRFDGRLGVFEVESALDRMCAVATLGLHSVYGQC